MRSYWAEGILLRHAEASSVNVLLDNGCGQYGTVNENDPALVSLRTDHTRVDLHALQTTISGEWAYPMVARGRLAGALVLGPKRSQESYAPDESAAIAQLALIDGVLSQMEQRLDAVADAMAQLPAAIARELRATLWSEHFRNSNFVAVA